MSKRDRRYLLILSLLVIAAAAGIILLGPRLFASQTDASTHFTLGYGADTVRAEVMQIVEEGSITLGETEQGYQILIVKLLEGPHAGRLLEIDLGRRRILPSEMRAAPGEQLLVTVGQAPDGALTGFFADFVRAQALLALFATFIVFSILISGWKGVRSLAAMFASLMVIVFYIIPRILSGDDPVLVSISGSFVVLTLTLYLTYGWTLKTHAAVAGTLIALVLTGLLAGYFVELTHLTGLGDENALMLIQQSSTPLDLRGLVLGGMIIGALGVLDDLVITQASAVFELHGANPSLPLRGLFRGAMRIGQDHVAATVNTLVLAYAGASLPMLLMFTLSGQQVGTLINIEFIAEEIVRTLVGSLGLISAVPVTTGLASLLAINAHRLGRWTGLLGPQGAGHQHSHH